MIRTSNRISLKITIFTLLFIVFLFMLIQSCKKNEFERVARVSTGTVSNIAATSASITGFVQDAGESGITHYGHCWSTDENPTADLDTKSSFGERNNTGNFSSNMTGLSTGTEYYVRAYAIYEGKESYGKNVSFITDAASAPVVTTVAPSDISDSSAVCGGNVTSDGGAAITARGVCWSTSENPGISDNCTSNGSDTGTFVSSITGLSPNTTYYVRAYATNSAGTGYGNQLNFTTANNPPVITSDAVKNATEDIAYSYMLTAEDEDPQDTLSFSVVQMPSWLDFNTQSGLLSGIPENDDVGDHNISLGVSDGYVTIYDNFTINVVNVNDTPYFTSSPPTSIEVDVPYSYQVYATDVDIGSSLTYYALQLPDWLEYSQSTNILYGTPTLEEQGGHKVILRVSDGTAYADQDFTINVYQPAGTVTDIDGNVYKTVKIGNQWWMAENINVGTKLSDSCVNQTNNSEIEKYCYRNQDSNCNIYGGLYQWDEAMQYSAIEEAQGICPSGWHIPSGEEYEEMLIYLGGLYQNSTGCKVLIDSTDYWENLVPEASNLSGFSAKGAGHRAVSCSPVAYYGKRQIAIFWTSTNISANYSKEFDLAPNGQNRVDYGDYGKGNAVSIRCIKD